MEFGDDWNSGYWEFGVLGGFWIIGVWDIWSLEPFGPVSTPFAKHLKELSLIPTFLYLASFLSGYPSTAIRALRNLGPRAGKYSLL